MLCQKNFVRSVEEFVIRVKSPKMGLFLRYFVRGPFKITITGTNLVTWTYFQLILLRSYVVEYILTIKIFFKFF